MALSTVASEAVEGRGAAKTTAAASARQGTVRFISVLTSCDPRARWVGRVSQPRRGIDVSVTNRFPESLPPRHQSDTRSRGSRAMLLAVTGRTATKSESMIDGLRELILRMGALAEAILAK